MESDRCKDDYAGEEARRKKVMEEVAKVEVEEGGSTKVTFTKMSKSSPPPRCSSLRTGRTASICSPPSSAGSSSFRWHLLVELRWKEKMHINRSIPRNHLE